MKPNHLYIHNVSTKRATASVDSGGSPISTFATNLSSLSCRVQPVGSGEDVVAGRQWSSPIWRVFCDEDSDITMKDIVVYGGVEYEIREKNIYPDTYMELIISK